MLDTDWSIGEIELLLVIVFCLFVGPFFVASGSREVARCYTASGWPTTEGITVSATVYGEPYTKSSYSRYEDPVAYRYMARIRYAYQVDGRQYVGHRMKLTDQVFNPCTFDEQAVINRLAGLKVQVHYDPDSPAESVLSTFPASGSIGQLCAGAFLFIAAALVLRYIIRKKQLVECFEIVDCVETINGVEVVGCVQVFKDVEILEPHERFG